MPVEEQVAILYCGTRGLLKNVPLNKVNEFQEQYLQILRTNHQDTILRPLAEGKLDDEISKRIEKVAADLTAQFS